MKNLVKQLNGYKTYIGLILAGLYGIGVVQGFINVDDPTWQTVGVLIGTWTGVSITHKANKALNGK